MPAPAPGLRSAARSRPVPSGGEVPRFECATGSGVAGAYSSRSRPASTRRRSRRRRRGSRSARRKSRKGIAGFAPPLLEAPSRINADGYVQRDHAVRTRLEFEAMSRGQLVLVALFAGCASGGAPRAKSVNGQRRAAPRGDSSVARHSSGPPVRVTALPSGWHCIKSADVVEMSTCFKTADQCAFGRSRLVAGGLRYVGCLPQARAACFSYHAKLQASDTFDCSATIAACSRQRAYIMSEGRADFENVRDCTAWD